MEQQQAHWHPEDAFWTWSLTNQNQQQSASYVSVMSKLHWIVTTYISNARLKLLNRVKIAQSPSLKIN